MRFCELDENGCCFHVATVSNDTEIKETNRLLILKDNIFNPINYTYKNGKWIEPSEITEA